MPKIKYDKDDPEFLKKAMDAINNHIKRLKKEGKEDQLKYWLDKEQSTGQDLKKALLKTVPPKAAEAAKSLSQKMKERDLKFKEEESRKRKREEEKETQEKRKKQEEEKVQSFNADDYFSPLVGKGLSAGVGEREMEQEDELSRKADQARNRKKKLEEYHKVFKEKYGERYSKPMSASEKESLKMREEDQLTRMADRARLNKEMQRQQDELNRAEVGYDYTQALKSYYDRLPYRREPSYQAMKEDHMAEHIESDIIDDYIMEKIETDRPQAAKASKIKAERTSNAPEDFWKAVGETLEDYNLRKDRKVGKVFSDLSVGEQYPAFFSLEQLDMLQRGPYNPDGRPVGEEVDDRNDDIEGDEFPDLN